MSKSNVTSRTIRHGHALALVIAGSFATISGAAAGEAGTVVQPTAATSEE